MIPVTLRTKTDLCNFLQQRLRSSITFGNLEHYQMVLISIAHFRDLLSTFPQGVTHTQKQARVTSIQLINYSHNEHIQMVRTQIRKKIYDHLSRRSLFLSFFLNGENKRTHIVGYRKNDCNSTRKIIGQWTKVNSCQQILFRELDKMSLSIPNRDWIDPAPSCGWFALWLDDGIRATMSQNRKLGRFSHSVATVKHP